MWVSNSVPRFFRWWCTGHGIVCAEEAGSRRGIVYTRRRHQWLDSLKYFSLQGYINRQVAVEDARYLSIYKLKARRNLFFYPPKLGLHEEAHSSFNYCCGRRHYKYAAVAYRSPPTCTIVVVWKALYQAGGGRLPTVPCVRFYTSRGGTAPYLPLYLVM